MLTTSKMSCHKIVREHKSNRLKSRSVVLLIMKYPLDLLHYDWTKCLSPTYQTFLIAFVLPRHILTNSVSDLMVLSLGIGMELLERNSIVYLVGIRYKMYLISNISLGTELGICAYCQSIISCHVRKVWTNAIRICIYDVFFNRTNRDNNPTIHHFVTETFTHVHISVTNGALWDLCKRSND